MLFKVLSIMETVKKRTDVTEKLTFERRLEGCAFPTELVIGGYNDYFQERIYIREIKPTSLIVQDKYVKCLKKFISKVVGGQKRKGRENW